MTNTDVEKEPESDVELGYEVLEETRTFEKAGTTGRVTRYTSVNASYPCYVVKEPFEEYKIIALKRMFSKINEFGKDTEKPEDAIHLYFEKKNGDWIKFNYIFPPQVSAFLRLFKGNTVIGYYDKDTLLENDYLYVLCG